jgi:hypothetical protein
MRCPALKAKAKADCKQFARDNERIHTLNYISTRREAATTRARKRKSAVFTELCQIVAAGSAMLIGKGEFGLSAEILRPSRDWNILSAIGAYRYRFQTADPSALDAELDERVRHRRNGSDKADDCRISRIAKRVRSLYSRGTARTHMRSVREGGSRAIQ